MKGRKSEFRLDYIDGLLLTSIYSINRWFLTKEISDALYNISKDEDKKSLNSFIRSRLNKYVKYGLMDKKRLYDSIYAYKLNRKKVVFGNSELVVLDNGKSKKFKFDKLLGIRVNNYWYFLMVGGL